MKPYRPAASIARTSRVDASAHGTVTAAAARTLLAELDDARNRIVLTGLRAQLARAEDEAVKRALRPRVAAMLLEVLRDR